MSKRLVLVASALLLSAAALVVLKHSRNLQELSKANHAGPGQTGPMSATRARAPQSTSQPARAREFDPESNPYAGSLREPGKSKRAWDADFLAQLPNVVSNTPIEFELTEGVHASGVIKITQTREGELCYISGELIQPEPGKFFFLKPPPGGKAGKAAGVVEFWGSKTAYRLEPTGADGEPELWKRRFDEVLCQTLPLKEEELAADPLEIPPLRPDLAPDYAPDYNSNIVSLQSYPGSSAVLLLDFFGGYTPTWGGVTYPRPNVSNAQIKDLWKRVAEDYMPFNINVTTDIRVYQSAPAASRQICVFSPSISAMPSGAAGVAYIGSWNWGSDTVCWSIYTSGKAGGEVGSHEAGHTIGLGHQGTTTSGYYSGQGSGATGWAPIMGAGYYDNVVSWAKGEYQNANNQEDELNIITTKNNSVAYRPDDTGNTLATSRYLETFSGNTASAEGVIERTGDTDAFQFTTGGGQVSLMAAPVGDWANLAISATLADANNLVIASNNPQTVLSATITTNLAAGTYTFRVTGAGRNTALTDGFSAYGSLGYYSITGTVAAARLPTRLTVAEHAPNGTLVGTVYPTTTNSSLAYSITSGNTGNTFWIDNKGTLRVANNSLLDYSRLATNSMLPVQFQLLVNITDLTDPNMTETGRRVVVSVLDVNDAPVATGFTVSLIEHTVPGTVVGTITVRDPDFGQQVTFEIVDGDPGGRFAVDSTGLVSVVADLDSAVQASYRLAIAVNDNVIGSSLVSTGYAVVNVVTNRTPFQTGSISYTPYDNTGSGTAVTDLTANGRWPRDPSSEKLLPTFEAPRNRADNFGAAIRGYLIPPFSGSYTFWIASDDSSELWISTSTNNTTLSRVAYVSGYTSSRQWTKFTTQQSAAITLTAGQGYYIEARMKEGGGDDHLAVAWRGPATANLTNVIPAAYLAPANLNFVPHATGFTATLRQGAVTGSWVGTVKATDANVGDALRYAITSGNAAGLFSIDADSGTVRVADEAAVARASGTYNLIVAVTDSGVPALGATTTASITVVGAESTIGSTLRREVWSNIGNGTAVSDLTNNAAYPGRPDKFETLTSFASAIDTADNYGSRIRVYLTPTTSGTYRFFISSDDASSFLMSIDDNPGNAQRIAYVNGWTPANNWISVGTQISGLRNLVAGQRYYMETLQKEGGGGDHVQVAWTGPGIVDTNGVSATNIIAGSFLTPVDLNYPPRIANQTLPVFVSVPNGSAIGRVLALDSAFDTLSFKIVDGNAGNVFAIDPETGIISVLDNTSIATGAATSFPLTVLVQDSGCGGLYMSDTAQAVVTISVQTSAGVPFVWTGAAATNAWGDAGNWGGALPGDGARLIFGFPWQQTNLNTTVSSLTSVQFTNSGFSLLGKPVSLSSGINNRGDNTWGVHTTLTGGQTWVNSSGTFTATGAITNSGYTLAISASGDVRLAGPISGAGILTKSGAARLIMQGRHSYSGNTVVASTGSTTTALEVGSADLELLGSDLTLSGRMDLGSHDATIGALNGTGVIFANDLTRTITLGANNHSGAFSGVLQNSASASGITLNLVKSGTGSQSLSGANTYSGVTAVTGGSLVVSSPTALGSTAGGTLVSSGASLALSNNITVAGEPLTLNGSGAGSSGALRNDYGLNTWNGPITLAGATTMRSANGRLTLGGAWNTTGNMAALTFDTAGAGSILVTSGIEGGGELVKIGPGTLSLYGTNNYFGLTTIHEGALVFGPNASARRSSGFVLSSGTTLNVSAVSGGMVLLPGQFLQGPGLIAGSLNVQGTLLPGDIEAKLSVNGNLTLAGLVSIEVKKAGTVLTNGMVQCSGVVTPGGDLTVTHLGPDALAMGDSLRLISAGTFAPGAFSTLNLPALAPGLFWDTSALYSEGILRVEPAAPPAMSVVFSSSSITLSWPPEYSNYRLEAQTNGLSSDWLPVQGVQSNGIVIPIDPANVSAMYRLVRP